MIDAQNFDFEKRITYYVVGTSIAINDLRAYAKLHMDNKIFYLTQFMERILFHDAYCFVTPQSMPYFPIAVGFKKKLKKADRWINLDGFMEVFFLARPEDAYKVMSISLEEALYIVEKNAWIPLFDVDVDYVVKRLRDFAGSSD